MIDDVEQISDEVVNQGKMLIRAVMWVSTLDNTGGRSSQMEERKALIEAVRRFLREKDYKTLYPMLEFALDHNKAWDLWARDLSNLTREMQAAVKTMSLIERQCIYDLAYSIAIRFRERSALSALLAGLGASLKNFFRSDDNKVIIGEYVNISKIEKSALNEMADILELPRKIIR